MLNTTTTLTNSLVETRTASCPLHAFYVTLTVERRVILTGHVSVDHRYSANIRVTGGDISGEVIATISNAAERWRELAEGHTIEAFDWALRDALVNATGKCAKQWDRVSDLFSIHT